MDRFVRIGRRNRIFLCSVVVAHVHFLNAAAPAIQAPTVPQVKPVPTAQTPVAPAIKVAVPAPAIAPKTVPAQTAPAVKAQETAPVPAAVPTAPVVAAPSPAPVTTSVEEKAVLPQNAPEVAQTEKIAPVAMQPAAPKIPTTPPKAKKIQTAPAGGLPLAPQAPAAAKVSEEKGPEQSVASKEFDTSKIKQYTGNWVIKRGWWENAESEYEKIRKVIEQLFDVRMAFFEKRNDLQRTLFEPFYRNIGFEQGELKDTLVYLIDQVEGARETEGTLDIKQREFLSVLDEEKKTLEQLKLDMDQFAKFDEAINNAIDLLMREINQARQYEQTSWREFKAIADDLSDIKARERYYTIRTLYKDVKNIYEYVRGDFKRYFDNLADTAHKEADRIKTTVAALKNKGIDLKIEAKKLAEEPSKAAQTPSCGIPTEESGYIMTAVYWVGGALKSTWNLVFGWIYRF